MSCPQCESLARKVSTLETDLADLKERLKKRLNSIDGKLAARKRDCDRLMEANQIAHYHENPG